MYDYFTQKQFFSKSKALIRNLKDIFFNLCLQHQSGDPELLVTRGGVQIND